MHPICFFNGVVLIWHLRAIQSFSALCLDDNKTKRLHVAASVSLANVIYLQAPDFHLLVYNAIARVVRHNTHLQGENCLVHRPHPSHLEILKVLHIATEHGLAAYRHANVLDGLGKGRLPFMIVLCFGIDWKRKKTRKNDFSQREIPTEGTRSGRDPFINSNWDLNCFKLKQKEFFSLVLRQLSVFISQPCDGGEGSRLHLKSFFCVVAKRSAARSFAWLEFRAINLMLMARWDDRITIDSLSAAHSWRWVENDPINYSW